MSAKRAMMGTKAPGSVAPARSIVRIRNDSFLDRWMPHVVSHGWAMVYNTVVATKGYSATVPARDLYLIKVAITVPANHGFSTTRAGSRYSNFRVVTLPMKPFRF
jgi:hypothetical protein